jgi:hypothetical protein
MSQLNSSPHHKFKGRIAQLPARLAPARTAASAATAAAVPAESTATTTARTTARPRGLRSRFIHLDGPSAELRFVQTRGRLLRFRIRAHFDESETTSTAGCCVTHHLHGFHRTELGKQLLEIGLVRVVGKIADVKFATHKGS